MATMLAGLLIIFTQINMLICPPLRRLCGCVIGTDGVSNSLTADCSNSPELDFDFDCLASQRPESLDLSGNKLQEVPAELNLSGFKDMKHLDLSRNYITSLVSYNFGAWKRLESLNISHNKLTDLPEGRSLIRSIDVSYNQLTDMESIFGLTYTTAIVRGNYILCKCNSSLVQRMYDLVKETFKSLTVIECTLHEKDTPKPITTQCMTAINQSTRKGTLSYVYVFYSIFCHYYFANNLL